MSRFDRFRPTIYQSSSCWKAQEQHPDGVPFPLFMTMDDDGNGLPPPYEEAEGMTIRTNSFGSETTNILSSESQLTLSPPSQSSAFPISDRSNPEILELVKLIHASGVAAELIPHLLKDSGQNSPVSQGSRECGFETYRNTPRQVEPPRSDNQPKFFPQHVTAACLCETRNLFNCQTTCSNAHGCEHVDEPFDRSSGFPHRGSPSPLAVTNWSGIQSRLGCVEPNPFDLSELEQSCSDPELLQPLPDKAGKQESLNPRLFVARIPFKFGSHDLRKYFEQFGSVLECNILRDKVTNASNGCGLVRFASFEDAKRVISTLRNQPRSKNQGANRMLVTFARGELRRLGLDEETVTNGSDYVKLFFGNVAPSTTEEKLEELFAKFGDVMELVILRGHRSKSKCSGFVLFRHREHAQDAITGLDKRFVVPGAARPLEVRFAETKSERAFRQEPIQPKCAETKSQTIHERDVWYGTPPPQVHHTPVAPPSAANRVLPVHSLMRCSPISTPNPRTASPLPPTQEQRARMTYLNDGLTFGLLPVGQ